MEKRSDTKVMQCIVAEELLAAVAAAVREPICVLPPRLAAVRLLGLPLSLFTTDPTATRLSTLPRHQVSLRLTSGETLQMLSLCSGDANKQVTVRAVAHLNRRRPTLAIVPSGKSCFRWDFVRCDVPKLAI